jgi:WLM domain
MAYPREQERARQLLRALAAQVRPIMKAHGFVVNSLEEVCQGSVPLRDFEMRTCASTNITASLLVETGTTERPSVNALLLSRTFPDDISGAFIQNSCFEGVTVRLSQRLG